ncbi:MAG TPA: hypothetical protein VFX75_01250 [Nitrososphaeraceae archaeon]|nr:hypothetical protein [Nitrososphaeraceae archaeon]
MDHQHQFDIILRSEIPYYLLPTTIPHDKVLLFYTQGAISISLIEQKYL